MMNILITKILPDETLALIASWGWRYDVVEALDIHQKEVTSIPPHTDCWIVSSRSSWPVVKTFLAGAPGFIYCVGNWLDTELKDSKTASVIKSFPNMQSLVFALQHHHFKHILYFCGDSHRHELEKGIRKQNTTLSKIITHESRLTYPVLKGQYDVVTVFSPRSGKSLLKYNNFTSQTMFACIGSTTLDYLEQQGISNSFCASAPDSELLLRELFTSQQPKN